MKKNLIILICIVTILSISGCSQNNYKDNTEKTSIEKVKNTEKKESKSSTETNKINMMKSIKEEGIKGFNIYCKNIKLGDNMCQVEEIYNKWSESNYVADAKGVYYNYKNDKFAFGCNKGDQIFEIRSYDENLRKLSLNDIEDYFGKADYENETSVGEKIIGYKISNDFKLLFVFQEDTLDHYSVFYPDMTANLMADDKGREW